MSQERLPGFKAYDVRGRVPAELNDTIAYGIGRAYAAEFAPAGPVVVGHDVRLSSRSLADALIAGLSEAGCAVRDIGQCGTEMVYFGAGRPGMGGGVMVTASHNPMEYNGMKFVREGAVPVSGDSGLFALERRVRTGDLGPSAALPGPTETEDILDAYIQCLLSFVDVDALKPLSIVVNPGNGGAGPIIDALEPHLPFTFIRRYETPDGRFPNGIPNPLLEENREATAAVVRETGADLGIAWDGDFDRCFFFDESGRFVDGYYIVGLLAAHMLKACPGARIVHDPRMTWNTVEMVTDAGGIPVQSRTGHAFMKERMRSEDAVYGGEMSAHHYFREFCYCDTGMVPWLIMASILSDTGKPMSQLVAARQERYPGSGELNTRVADPQAVIARVDAAYRPAAEIVEEVDGLSMAFRDGWRFNLRCSQTEPILRLNVETRGDQALLRRRTDALLALINP